MKEKSITGFLAVSLVLLFFIFALPIALVLGFERKKKRDKTC